MPSIKAQSALASILTKIIRLAGTEYPNRKALNFIGAGISVVDNEGDDSTDVTISGGGGGGGVLASATVQGEVQPWGGSVPIGAFWGRTGSTTSGYSLPVHGTQTGGSLHALAGSTGAGFAPTTASKTPGSELVLDSALNPAWVTARVPMPHHFIPDGQTKASVQAAGGWRPIVAAMFAFAASTTGVCGFEQNYTYNILGTGTTGTDLIVPDNIEIQGNSATLLRVGGGVNENILDFTGTNNVIVSYLNVNGNHLGNGASGSLGHCVHFSGSGTDVYWVGGSIKNYGVANVTGAAWGVGMHDAPKRIHFKDIKFSQANASTGSQAFAFNSLFTAGAEDVWFEDCDWDCANLKVGYALDGLGCKRFKVTGGAGFKNAEAHGIAVGYSNGAQEFDVTFSDLTVHNCPWTGISLQGPLGVGAGNYGVKMRRVVFSYCGGGGASIGNATIWVGHKSIDLQDVTILENGIAYATNTARTYAGDAVYRPSTPQDACAIDLVRLKVKSVHANSPGGIDMSNCDYVNAPFLDIDAAYGARFAFGFGGADAAGARRKVFAPHARIKGTSPAWYGLQVAGHFGVSAVDVQADDIDITGPATGSATANPEHSGIRLTNVGSGLIRGRVYGYNRDNQSSGLYLDEDSTEALYQSKLRLDLTIDTCHHGTWLPAVAAGSTWLLMPELNYINCTAEVTVVGAGAARLKRAPSAYGRKVVYNNAAPAAGAGAWKANDVCLHDDGTRHTCTVAGNPGTWV